MPGDTAERRVSVNPLPSPSCPLCAWLSCLPSLPTPSPLCGSCIVLPLKQKGLETDNSVVCVKMTAHRPHSGRPHLFLPLFTCMAQQASFHSTGDTLVRSSPHSPSSPQHRKFDMQSVSTDNKADDRLTAMVSKGTYFNFFSTILGVIYLGRFLLKFPIAINVI